MLVINADDFGMAENINHAIGKCFREGICSSTTIMPNMPGFEGACALAFEQGFHGHVGMHLVLSEGVPITAAIRKERRFCNREGEFCLSRESPILRMKTSEKHALAAEIRGQIRKCRDQGITISHVDSHLHVHTEWGISKVLLPIVREERIPFVRIARNLVMNPDIIKRLYKTYYNANLRRVKLRATDYFGSVDEYLHFLEIEKGGNRIIEVMIHPHYKEDNLYVTDSMQAVQYSALMRNHYDSEGSVSFLKLIPFRYK